MIEDHQTNEELRIFEKFISVYPDEINKDTIKKIDPPYPDIYCETRGGQKIYFELTECVIPSIAESTGNLIKECRSRKPSPMIEVRTGRVTAYKEDALFEKSMQKFGKKYEREDTKAPIELLSYFNQQAEPLGDVLLNYERFVELNVKTCMFKRVWVYSVYLNEILFSFQ